MKYDNYVIGQLQIDYDVYPNGKVETLIGGPFLFAAYAGISSGRKVGGLCNISKRDAHLAQAIYLHDLSVAISTETASYRVTYHDDTQETRTISLDGIADPLTVADLPSEVESKVFQLAGAMLGQTDDAFFEHLSVKGKLACDLQSFLRQLDGTSLVFRDWADKKRYLPHVTYLKLDAKEAAVTTGLSDRREAAKMIHSWGVKEILITHNTEAMVYDGTEFHTVPLRPRSTVGRSGRGDSTFGSYITERNERSIPESLLYASALVSLKMERRGPFRRPRSAVEAFIQETYPDFC